LAGFTADAIYFSSDADKLTDGVIISSNGRFEITNGWDESTNGAAKTTNGVIKFTNRSLDFTDKIIKTTNKWAKRTNRRVKLTNDVKISSNNGFWTAKCTILAAAAFELDGEWVGKLPVIF
jgi:hypothetical protein